MFCALALSQIERLRRAELIRGWCGGSGASTYSDESTVATGHMGDPRIDLTAWPMLVADMSASLP